MKTDDLNTIWIDIEAQRDARDKSLQRLIYVDLIYRVYIGTTGIPPRRFLSIEIPKTKKTEFDSFIVPRGFTLTIDEPEVKHEGYIACVLQAATFDQNDVFTVLAKDILDDLRKQNNANQYIDALKKRIEKWRIFFKNPAMHRLSDQMIIGLFGELSFVKDLHKNGVDCGADFWNGPIKAAQDFQGNHFAIEIKTMVANKLENVHISSETQLDDNGREALFLVVYRIERNDSVGVTLPSLIREVAELISKEQRSRFYANLICLGYSNEDVSLYNKGYSIKESKVYRVKGGFPRLLRQDLPQGVMNIRYELALQNCEAYRSDLNEIVKVVKEFEDGEN